MKICIHDIQSHTRNNSKYWTGKYRIGTVIGHFRRSSNSLLELVTLKDLDSEEVSLKQKSDVLNILNQHIYQYHFFGQNTEINSNEYFFKSNEAPLKIEIEVGPVAKIESTGVTYKPELIITTDQHKIHWKWSIKCERTSVLSCHAIPGSIVIFNFEKKTIHTFIKNNKDPEIKKRNYKNDQYKNIYKEIENFLKSPVTRLASQLLIKKLHFTY